MFFDKKIRVLTWSGFKRLRNGSTMLPPLLNICSDGTLVPGTDKYFFAKFDNNGNKLLLLLHQSSGLESASAQG